MGLMRAPAVLALLACSLLACSPAPRQKPADAGPDIGSLEQSDPAISPEPPPESAAPPVDPQQEAVQHYQRFVELAPDNDASGLAQQRIADLQLETAGAGGDPARSIEIYERILREQPSATGDERILYQLARAYEANGQLEQSLATLETFLRRYPESEQAQEARFRSGELLFALQRYREAERFYVLHYRYGEKSPYYEPALYKLAWCHYKQAQYPEALANFYRVLERHPGAYGPDSPALDTGALERAQRELLEDSLRGIALSYAAQGPATAVQPELQRLAGRPYELLVVDRLVRHYLEQRRYSDAAHTLQAFAQRNPRNPRAAAMMAESIEIYARGDFPSQAVAGKAAYVQRFAAQADDPAVRGKVETFRREVAEHYFNEAQRTQRREDIEAAIRSYREVLASAPESPESSRMRFQLAEQLYRSGQYAAAAEEYERVAYGRFPGADGAAAAYGLTVSWQQAANQAEGAQQQAAHRSFIDAALRLAERYPAHPEKAAALTRSAELLLELKELPKAAEVARRVLKLVPEPPASLRYSAGAVLAAAEFQQERFAEAEAAYRELLRLAPERDPRRVDLKRALAASLYRQAELRKQAGDLRAAAELFLRVGEAVPDSDIRATADYDAAAAFISLKDWPRAIRVLEDFRSRHPQHPLQAEVGRKLALAYTENGQKDRAAVEYARIGAAGGENEAVRQEAAWQAAELHAQAGQTRQAVAAYEKFLTQFPQTFDRGIEARQRLIELNAAAGDLRAARRWQQALVEADANGGAARSERSRYLAARAALALADGEREAFQKLALKPPLDASLRAKKAQMEKALAAYGRAADYGVAEVLTAATCRLGELYFELSRALLDSPRPRGLSAEELAQYNVLLEEQAFPFEEKAIEIHETNIRRAASGVYDAWVQRSLDALAQLAPARYAKLERGDDLVQALR
jgi:cellulose synthase operon protein C